MNNIFLKLLDRKGGNIYLSPLTYLRLRPICLSIQFSTWMSQRTSRIFLKMTSSSLLLAGWAKCYQLFPDLVNVTINQLVSQVRTLRTKFDSSNQYIPLIIISIYLSSVSRSVHLYYPIQIQSITIFTFTSLLQQPSDCFASSGLYLHCHLFSTLQAECFSIQLQRNQARVF